MGLTILAATLFLLIGIILSLLGSGGALLTIPVLVYIFDINPYWATSYSMLIMGLSNWTASIYNIRQQNILYQVAWFYALPGLAVTYLIRKMILPLIPQTLLEYGEFKLSKESLIMFLLSFLILFTALRTLKKKEFNDLPLLNLAPQQYILHGACIGLITGFVGAGGGFLIVPLLAYRSNIPIKQAIATSLFIISITTSLGFLGDLNSSIIIDWNFITLCSIFSIMGVLIANTVKEKLSDQFLKKMYGYFILCLGILVLIVEIKKMI